MTSQLPFIALMVTWYTILDESGQYWAMGHDKVKNK
jgi:hypothetical protein